MPRITTVQAAHSYGVLDPHVIERRDTKFLGSSLSDAENIILLPQGGYTDRGGSTDFGRVRRKLTPITINTTILSLPNGGSESDLLAGTAITTSAASTTRFVLFECDFSVATLVHMIDIKGVSIATTAAADALLAEYWNGAAWVAFGGPVRITVGDGYSRRFASGAPGHAGISATKFRVCVNATTAAGAVTFSGIAFWVESPTLSDAIVRRYAPEQGMAHQLVWSDNNIDVFVDGLWQASVALPAAEGIIRTIKQEPRFDTILAFEQVLPPQAIVRLGSSDEWACDPLVFQNIPLEDYGEIYTNGVNEVQELRFIDASLFDLTVEGRTTGTITRTSDTTASAAAIKAALEALPNVDPGIIVTATSSSTYQIEFAGGNNAARDWLPMVATLSGEASGAVLVRTITQGEPAGENIMSDARGWPAVGRFAQQRLIMAGLKSRPNYVIASFTGSPFDLDTTSEVATRGFAYEVDGSENNVIRDMMVGRTLLLFGDQQLSFLKNNVLSANDAPEFGSADTPGLKAGTSPVSSDNAIFTIQEGGTTLRMTSYTELEQTFVSDNASVLSAFLIRNPTELFRRRAVGAVDSDLLMMVNADGTMTALTMMRTQEVSGFAPWTTDGAWRSGCVDHDNVTWWLVEREVNGTPEIRLEKMEPDKLLDEAVEIVQASSATITGLARFNGREVYAVANDSIYGPHTVSGGQIEVDEAVTLVRVGTWKPVSATDPEVSLTEETRTRMARLKRVNRAEISVVDTTSIAIRANDGPLRDIALRSNDDTQLDEGPLARPFTGKVEAEGMHGFTDHGRMSVGQTYPGFITVRSVTKNIVA